MSAAAPFLTSLPPQHPQRALLHNEIHARPPEAIEAPVASTHIVMWTDAAAREVSRAHLGTLLRCCLRVSRPAWSLADYPHGFMTLSPWLTRRVPVPPDDTARSLLTTAVSGDVSLLLAAFDALPLPAKLTEQEFWQEERENLASLCTAIQQSPS